MAARIIALTRAWNKMTIWLEENGEWFIKKRDGTERWTISWSVPVGEVVSDYFVVEWARKAAILNWVGPWVGYWMGKWMSDRMSDWVSSLLIDCLAGWLGTWLFDCGVYYDSMIVQGSAWITVHSLIHLFILSDNE